MNTIISSNIYNFYKNINDACNGKYYATNNYEVVKSEIYLFPNTIYNLKLTLKNYKFVISEIENKIKENIYPPKIVTELNSIPFEFIQYFIENNSSIEIQPGMLLILDKIRIHTSNEVKIIEVNNMQFKEWASIISESFFDSKDITEEQIELIANLSNIKLWGAIYKEKIVGACLTQSDNDVIGLHFVGVKNEFRKLGIGKFLSQQSIINHNNGKAKYAILRASKYGENIYKEIGFREYTKFVILS